MRFLITFLIVFNFCVEMKWGKSCKTARNLFADYIYNSSIHGLKYTAERNRPAAEGIFWIFVVIISIYGSWKMISNTWKKWNESPIVVTFNEMELPVWKIPFPALTICPETKTQSAHFNFTKAIHKVWDESQDSLTSDEKRNLNAMLQVCDNFYSEDIDMSYKSDSNISEVLSKLSIKKNESFFSCSWGKSFANKDSNCDNFKEILTEEGVCFTFNSLDVTELYKEGSMNLQINKDQSIQLSQWSLDDGYDEDAGIDAYPDRVLGSGLRSGVKILMYEDKENFDYLCRGAIQGFKVILHPPNEVPQVSSQYIRIPPDMDVTIEVSPEMILTSEELKNYALKRRQCYFEKERDLQYFNIYTQSSCEMECLTNYTINKCGCAKFSMPRSPDVRVCDSSDVQCYVKAEKDLLLSEANIDAEHNDEDGIGCNCLPTCTSLTYSSSISQADYYNSRALQRKDLNSDFSMSRITIFFKENQFLPSKRSEVFGMADFLSNCGGLLGLFMGISVISLTEIFYFMTIRVAPS